MERLFALFVMGNRTKNSQDWELRAALTVLSGLIFTIDLMLPLGVAGGVLYGAPVVLSLRGIRRQTTLYAASLAAALILLGYAFSPSGGIPWMVAANRALSLGAVGVVAILGLKGRQSEKKILHLNRALEKQILETRSERDETEDIFRSVLEIAPNGILAVDKRGNIVLANSEAGRLFGYPREELLGSSIEMLVPERFREDHPGKRKDFGRNPTLRPMGSGLDLYGRRKDGGEFPVEISLSHLYTSRGLLVTVIVRDVTDRKQSEVELRESEERFRQLAENMKDVVYLRSVDDYEVLYVNAAVEKVFGKTREQFANGKEAFRQSVHPDDHTLLQEVWTRQTSGDFEVDVEYRIVLPDQSIRWIRGRTFPIRDETGKIIRVGNIHTDITEQKNIALELRQFNVMLEQRVAERSEEVRRSEAKLAEAQRRESIGQLAGGVAHDFNNLMTVINGYTELLLIEVEGKQNLIDKLTQIKAASDRAANLTQKLLAYSRQLVIRPQTINLNSIIEDVRDRLCPIPMEGFTVLTHLDPHLAHAVLDPNQIEEVVLGLTLNACEAMPSGGTLTVETSNEMLDSTFARQHPEVQPGRYVKLSIIDTGIGMDNEILKSIFEPFFTTKDKSTGAGMGLASIYGMVRQSGGFIEVRSKKGEGTRVDVYFPSLDPIDNGGEQPAAT